MLHCAVLLCSCSAAVPCRPLVSLPPGSPAPSRLASPATSALPTTPAPPLATFACRQLALLAGWSLATYSLPAHKEFRFLLPALQLLMPYCGWAAARLWRGGGSGPRPSTRSSRADGGGGRDQQPAGRRLWRWGAAACIALQLPMATYFLLVHQR